MPRRSGGGGRSSSFGATPASPPHPPAPVHSQPVANGIGSTIIEGMAFGGGNAMGHRAVDAVMGPRVVKHETVVSATPPPPPAAAAAEPATLNILGVPGACGNQFQSLHVCLNHYEKEISKCQMYMDVLSECRKSSTTTTGLNA